MKDEQIEGFDGKLGRSRIMSLNVICHRLRGQNEWNPTLNWDTHM